MFVYLVLLYIWVQTNTKIKKILKFEEICN